MSSVPYKPLPEWAAALHRRRHLGARGWGLVRVAPGVYKQKIYYRNGWTVERTWHEGGRTGRWSAALDRTIPSLLP